MLKTIYINYNKQKGKNQYLFDFLYKKSNEKIIFFAIFIFLENYLLFKNKNAIIYIALMK